MELCTLTATELLKGFRSKDCSPVEALDSVLARIAKCDGQLNAFRLVDAESALVAARASERRWMRGEPVGLVDGVPTSIKDVLLTKGWSTRLGSNVTSENGFWEEDAPPVGRLREAGAIFIGKTNTSEFHWKTVTDSPLTGITRNPWNPDLTPGGSCGGATVAVATGMGPLSIGTDGGGSIRVPCSFTGVFGLKPSFGRIPQFPAGAFGTMAHVGPITRSVTDAALMVTIMSRPDVRDWYALPFQGEEFYEALNDGIKGVRIAYSPDLGYVNVDPLVSTVVAQAVAVFEECGAHVEQVAPGFKDTRLMFETLGFPGIASSLSRFSEEEKVQMDPGLIEVAELGARVHMMDYMDATRAREALGLHMNRFHESFDLLVTPTVPILPFSVGQDVPDPDTQKFWTEWVPFSYPFNLTCQPAASLPCGLTAEGLPVGLQVIGPLYGDSLVLKACHAFELARPFHEKKYLQK